MSAPLMRTKTIGKVDLSALQAGASRAGVFLANDFERCIDAKNELVDKGAPENRATYADCWKLKPGHNPNDDMANCREIQRRRLYVRQFNADALNRALGKTTLPIVVDIEGLCRGKVAAIKPPSKTPWDWISLAVDTAGEVLSDAGDVVTSIPVVGDILQVAHSGVTGPFRVSIAIANGERIDRVVMRELKTALKDLKTIAPYAQAVVSFIPGLGTVASAAIAGGLALAEGKPIDQALVAAVKGALPGGPIAQAAFAVGEGVISGRPIEQIGINALPIPDKAKDLLKAGASVTRSLAEGKSVEKILLEEGGKLAPIVGKEALNQLGKIGVEKFADNLLTDAKKLIPPNAQDAIMKGFTVGTAVAEGRLLQETAGRTIQKIQGELIEQGKRFVRIDAITKAAYDLIPPEGRRGFELAQGILNYKLSDFDFISARDALNGAERLAFDTAVSLWIGRVERARMLRTMKRDAITTMKQENMVSLLGKNPVKGKGGAPVPPAVVANEVKAEPVLKGNPAADAAYLLTRGMVTANESQRVAMMSLVAPVPKARVGAELAIEQIREEREGWFDWLLRFFGIAPARRAAPPGRVMAQ